MMQYWDLLRARVAKLELRQRAIVLAALLLLAYVFIDALLLSPVLARRKAALDQLSQSQNQFTALSVQVQTLIRSKAADPDAANRARLEELRSNIAAFESEAREQSLQLISAQRMRAVLQQILASRPGLELVELKTLPQSTITLAGEAQKPSGDAQKPSGAATAPEAPVERAHVGTLYKHGVQLTVRGRYLDLLAYLKQIEALPAKLYWDKLELTVVEHPTLSMRFTLYTISLDKAWIQV
jgi:MSHA biogenesis protein MshJ